MKNIRNGFDNTFYEPHEADEWTFVFFKRTEYIYMKHLCRKTHNRDISSFNRIARLSDYAIKSPGLIVIYNPF